MSQHEHRSRLQGSDPVPTLPRRRCKTCGLKFYLAAADADGAPCRCCGRADFEAIEPVPCGLLCYSDGCTACGAVAIPDYHEAKHHWLAALAAKSASNQETKAP